MDANELITLFRRELPGYAVGAIRRDNADWIFAVAPGEEVTNQTLVQIAGYEPGSYKDGWVWIEHPGDSTSLYKPGHGGRWEYRRRALNHRLWHLGEFTNVEQVVARLASRILEGCTADLGYDSLAIG